MAKRTDVVLEEKLVKDIDRFVGARQRSNFLEETAEEKLMRYPHLSRYSCGAGSRQSRRAHSLRWSSEGDLSLISISDH